MEMKELDYFIAIAEEKSISKAAERLFMAQSSLSQFLGILENNVGRHWQNTGLYKTRSKI